MSDVIENGKTAVTPIDERAGTTLNIDDGCDWSDWLIWNMNSRRRLSEKVFTFPPTRPQVVPASAKPKKKIRRRKIRRAVEAVEC